MFESPVHYAISILRDSLKPAIIPIPQRYPPKRSIALRTPNPTQEDDSPSGENSSDFPQDELQPIFNPATENRPMMNEEEWMAQFSIVEDTLYNPVTMSFIEPDED
jgi:hypothetical protein